MNTDSISIDKIKEDIIQSIINDLTITDNLTDLEIIQKRNELTTKIKAKDLIVNKRTQSNRTNSKNFNDTIEELYIDILTTFGYINELDSTIDKHIVLNHSTLNSIRSLINKANDQIDSIECVLSSKGNPNYHIEGFRDAASSEEDVTYYKERYGEVINSGSHAKINLDEENISLPYLANQNMIVYKNGLSNGNIKVKKQLGSGFLKTNNDSNVLGNVIDTSIQSYWCNNIFCDSKLEVDYPSERPTDASDLEDFYYGINKGAMFELELTMDSITDINELNLLPYGKYPIELVAVKYKTSDDPNEDVKELIYPTNKLEGLQGKSMKGLTSYKFPTVGCKKIIMLFNQRHYVKETVIYNTNEVFKNELWFNITNKNNTAPLLPQDVIFAPLYNEKSEQDNIWSYINNLLTKNKNIDLKDILFKKSTINKVSTKYKYEYGFYNISPNYNNYDKMGMYVSKPIVVNGNIKSMTIDADETHYIDAEDKQLTDIEYYVSYKNNPAPLDWIPILPIGRDIVPCELLQVYNGKCDLRFIASALIEVKVNELILLKDTDYYVNKNIDGNIVSLSIPKFDFFSKYTVSYKPLEGYNKIDLIQDENIYTLSTFETIECNNNSYYSLENYPYIPNDNTVCTNMKLHNKKTGAVISQDNDEILCMTDPYDTHESYRKFDKLRSSIQYYTDKNIIFFNQNISSDYTIEMNYEHYVSQIRLKAIIRRNSLRNNWMTSSLNNIKYEFILID